MPGSTALGARSAQRVASSDGACHSCRLTWHLQLRSLPTYARLRKAPMRACLFFGMQAQWTSDTSSSVLFVGFELSQQAHATGYSTFIDLYGWRSLRMPALNKMKATAAVLLRAPFGLRPPGASCSSALRLQARLLIYWCFMGSGGVNIGTILGVCI